ncbi:MAG TPA: DUF4411 family protein [Ignavibacteria bacterium]|nr:DUF4411 family protein [Ignavibacteria bacterium]
MTVVIDTSSLMALVRYYLPFDKDDSLKDFFRNKVEHKEIIIIDKVAIESKRNAKGIITTNLSFINEKKNQVKTDLLLPTASFLRDLENRFCYVARKNTLTEPMFENRKKEYLESADAKLILFCLSNKNPLNFEKTILVTEETKTDNDLKVFKKLPVICDLLKIEHCNLPTLLDNHYNLKLSKHLK